MRKGVVMEVGDRDMIVLTDAGAFVRVARKGRTVAVGEEIALPAARRALPRRPLLAWSSTVAAAMAIVVFLFAMFPGGTPTVEAQPVAYVSIDINPSVELGIDEDENVVRATARNEDAVDLLSGQTLVGKPLSEAVAMVMEAAEAKLLSERAEADIVITSVVIDEKAPVVETELQARVQSEVDRIIRLYHADASASYRVTVWSAPKEILEEAESVGLSAGKMAFYLKAKASGLDVTTEDLQRDSMREIAERYREAELLAPDPKFTKETIKELLKQAKEAAKAEKKADKEAEKDDESDDADEGSGGADGEDADRAGGGNDPDSDKSGKNDKNDKNDKNGKEDKKNDDDRDGPGNGNAGDDRGAADDDVKGNDDDRGRGQGSDDDQGGNGNGGKGGKGSGKGDGDKNAEDAEGGSAEESPDAEDASSDDADESKDEEERLKALEKQQKEIEKKREEEEKRRKEEEKRNEDRSDAESDQADRSPSSGGGNGGAKTGDDDVSNKPDKEKEKETKDKGASDDKPDADDKDDKPEKEKDDNGKGDQEKSKDAKDAKDAKGDDPKGKDKP